MTGLFEVRAQEYLETLPIGEHSGVNKFLKGLGEAPPPQALTCLPCTPVSPDLCQALPLLPWFSRFYNEAWMSAFHQTPGLSGYRVPTFSSSGN